MEDAVVEARNRKLIAKSKQRDRRVLTGEEEKLMEYFARQSNRSKIPMADIFQFALHTSRREEEITRLMRKDLDRENGVAWLDDVKHPRKKKGNRRKFRVLAEAWEIMERQPESDERVFPYNPNTIGEMFRRACKVIGIKNLRFHDTRHEATSRLFERGYDIPEVAQFTLHESWATLKRYTHLKPEDVPEKTKRRTTPARIPHAPGARHRQA
jgi:integrase